MTYNDLFLVSISGGKIQRPHGFVYNKTEAYVSHENEPNKSQVQKQVFLSIFLHVLKHAVTTGNVKQGIMTF